MLLDENLDVRLRLWLTAVEASSAEFMGWKGVRNGELARRALAHGYEVFVTADRILAENGPSRSPLGCVLVTTNQAAELKPAAPMIEEACLSVRPRQKVVLRIHGPRVRSRPSG